MRSRDRLVDKHRICLPLYAEQLKDYLWTNRVIVTFSSDKSAPERLLLINQILKHACEYSNRNLVHVDLIAGSNDYQSLSQRFSLINEDFKLILIGKDGLTKLITKAVSLESIFSLIDAMPMRQKEIRTDKCP